MVIMTANCGTIFFIDEEDRELVESKKWCLKDGGYIRTTSTGELLHRVIMGAKKGQIIDHKDRDPKNNCRSNLRFATNSQNSINRAKKPGCASRFKGVCFKKHRVACWEAKIKLNRKFIYCGVSSCEIEAAKMYNKKAVELYGDFAVLNEVA